MYLYVIVLMYRCNRYDLSKNNTACFTFTNPQCYKQYVEGYYRQHIIQHGRSNPKSVSTQFFSNRIKFQNMHVTMPAMKLALIQK